MRASVSRARYIRAGFLAQHYIFVNEQAGGFTDVEQSSMTVYSPIA
ncbi:MAG: hypothetical protein OJF50_005895 [Nitrospira sp.]|nr:hypothetical protein [Nitrospira sp.]